MEPGRGAAGLLAAAATAALIGVVAPAPEANGTNALSPPGFELSNRPTGRGTDTVAVDQDLANWPSYLPARRSTRPRQGFRGLLLPAPDRGYRVWNPEGEK